MREELAQAPVVIQAPIHLNQVTWDWVHKLPDIAPKSYRLLIAHRSMFESDQFAAIARNFHAVQIHLARGRLLRGASADRELDLAQQACRLGFITRYKLDYILFAEDLPGILHVAEYRATGRYPYKKIEHPVPALTDGIAENTFASAWGVGKMEGRSVDEALAFAGKTAAASVEQGRVKVPYHPLIPPPAA
jgi:hypothetical protein